MSANVLSPGLIQRRRLIGGFFFLAPIGSVYASHSIVPLLIAAAVLVAHAVWRTRGQDGWPRPEMSLTLVLAGLTLVGAIASLWSFDVPSALLLSVRIGALFAAGVFLHATMRDFDDEARTWAGTWLLAGTVLALLVLYLEPVFDFPVLSRLHGLTESSDNIYFLLNRGATATAILCWPACAFLWRRAGAVVALCLPAAVLGALALLSSQSAGLGLLAGFGIALLAGLHRKAGRAVLILATLGAMILSPIAGHGFYQSRLQDAKGLSSSVGHRVEIWNFTVQRFLEKPVLGWGFDASRNMDRLSFSTEPSGRNPIANHPHNAPLQILLELGLLGALMVLAVTWVLIERLESLPRRERILGQAAYMAALSISCTAYGIWQNQWLALLMTAALAVSLSAPAPEKPKPAGGQ